jgi:acyl-CoA hydrolase
LNQAIEMRAPDYTHDSLVMGGIDNLVAINSAIEIDLTGQVNAEVAGDRHVGLIGGSGDFTRGALRSPGGRSILVMDATARRGTASRVVAKLARGTVTTSRGDADVVVTEYGMAELRGRTVSERAVALIEVAHPNFRAELKRAADDGLM